MRRSDKQLHYYLKILFSPTSRHVVLWQALILWTRLLGVEKRRGSRFPCSCTVYNDLARNGLGLRRRIHSSKSGLMPWPVRKTGSGTLQSKLRYSASMPGKCSQCGSKTRLGRTTIQSEIIEIRNIPCTVCEECGHEQIGQRVQKSIDKLLERAGKGKLKTRVVVL